MGNKEIKIETPIVIVGMEGSGTSLIAGLFYYHGMWMGPIVPGDIRNPLGYFENRVLIKSLRNVKKTAKAKKAITRNILQMGYKGGVWGAKHSALLKWELWKDFNPHWILCRRPFEDIKNSHFKIDVLYKRNKPKLNEKRLLKKYRSTQKVLNRLRDEYGGIDLFADDIVNGDVQEISKTLEKFGLTPSEKVFKIIVRWFHMKLTKTEKQIIQITIYLNYVFH